MIWPRRLSFAPPAARGVFSETFPHCPRSSPANRFFEGGGFAKPKSLQFRHRETMVLCVNRASETDQCWGKGRAGNQVFVSAHLARFVACGAGLC